VVHDADDVDDATMLGFARETRAPETTFVQTAQADGADYRNRIWMTTRELPFAGHPSLGTAVAVARARGDTAASYVQETGAGRQAIEVEVEGRVGRASMFQEPAEFGAELDPAEVMPVVGLSASAAHRELPPRLVSTGLLHLVVPVGDPGVLAHCRPDPAALGGLLDRVGATCIYVVAWDPGSGRARARSFYAGVGGKMEEDPATGSAAGPLVAYLHHRMGASEVRIEQGVEMGRASVLDASTDGDKVSVAGDVFVLAEGTIEL
jgi:trans-2,3-dihydro-3-hydroxyanthranilate isomerase